VRRLSFYSEKFAQDAGLKFDPNTYGNQQRGTYQVHPPDPGKYGKADPAYNDWPHVKYMFGKGVMGHIFYPPGTEN
jgi:hypothetical protein